MTIDLNKLKQQAASTGVDQSKTQAGGNFEREVPPEGPCKLRLISYIELGEVVSEYQGKPKKAKKVRLDFEVTGPKYPARKAEDGTEYPVIATIVENLTQSEKGNWPKLFSLLNYDRSATHAVEKLGAAYVGRIVHKKWKRKTDPTDPAQWTGLDIKLRDETGYTIRAPRREDPDTGDIVPVNVDPAKSKIRAFLWNAPDMDQWNSLFIDGEYPERKDEKTGAVIAPAKSKNVLQGAILKANNFKGSPIHELLASRGVSLDIPDVDEDMDGGDEAPAKPAPTPAAKVPVKKSNVPDFDDDIPF